MSFELQTRALVGPLTEVWPEAKVIREMPYKELRNVMAAAPADWRAEALAAAAIGVPLEEFLNLPGRYSGAVANLLGVVTRMHGLGGSIEEEVDGTALPGEVVPVGKH